MTRPDCSLKTCSLFLTFSTQLPFKLQRPPKSPLTPSRVEQVSGPTGPMTVVTAGIVSHFPQQPQCVFAVVILAGLIQIVMGLAGLGQYIRWAVHCTHTPGQMHLWDCFVAPLQWQMESAEGKCGAM